MNFRKHLFSGIVLQGIGLSLFAQTDKPNIVVIMTDQQRADLCLFLGGDTVHCGDHGQHADK